MRWKILVSATYLQPVIDRYRPWLAEHDIEVVLPPVNERMEEADLLPWVGDIDGAICGDDRFTARVLDAAPRLKVISKWGTGIDSIDQVVCRQRGITVCNTPNAFSEPVADTVLGYILCFARGLLVLDQHMKAGIWQKTQGRALRECTLGVIGVGNVGKAVVRRAVAFGMRVLGNDPVAMPADFLAATGITMVSKEDLLRQADFVSLNCDLNSTSFHLMDTAAFGLMKPDAVIINIARGPITEEPALVAALRAMQIAGAALDVFEEEPLPADSPLRWMDNVLLAPHNANASPEAWERVHQGTIKNLIDALNKSSR